MTPVLTAIVYTMSAGILNGSFALPTKYVRNWNFENIWLNYAFWSFLFLPWIVIFILDRNIVQVYRMMPSYTLFILIIGGLLFGIGQVCFALSLKIIGFSLGFVINLGLATGLGFLLPLIFIHPQEIFTEFGLITFVGIFFIIGGLWLSYKAGSQRDAQKPMNSNKKDKSYKLGVFLAIVAGIFSAGQNFTFALTSNMQQLALASGSKVLAAAIVIWPAFLTCSFVPYAMYMLFLHGKHDSFSAYKTPGSLKNAFFAVIMGLFWYGSLVGYSQAALLIGNLGPIIVWPLFMVLIILTSNFWGWKSKEWLGCSVEVRRNAIIAMLLLITAVIILGSSALVTN